jgi:hypothetical protein
MIAVLGGLADLERDLIPTRTAEGRSRAQKKRGHHMGRPPALVAKQRNPSSAAARALRWPSLPTATLVGISTIRRVTRAA